MNSPTDRERPALSEAPSIYDEAHRRYGASAAAAAARSAFIIGAQWERASPQTGPLERRDADDKINTLALLANVTDELATALERLAGERGGEEDQGSSVAGLPSSQGRSDPMGWRTMESAPRGPRHEGYRVGPRVYLLIPYSPQLFAYEKCWDIGWWDLDDECFRFTGDDGPYDIQPTHWAPLNPPENDAADRTPMSDTGQLRDEPLNPKAPDHG